MIIKAKKRKVGNSYVITIPPVIAQNMKPGEKYDFDFKEKHEVK